MENLEILEEPEGSTSGEYSEQIVGKKSGLNVYPFQFLLFLQKWSLEGRKFLIPTFFKVHHMIIS